MGRVFIRGSWHNRDKPKCFCNMTIIIEYKTHMHVIRPKVDGEPKFDGSISKLVEAVTLSNYRKGIKTFKKYYVT